MGPERTEKAGFPFILLQMGSHHQGHLSKKKKEKKDCRVCGGTGRKPSTLPAQGESQCFPGPPWTPPLHSALLKLAICLSISHSPPLLLGRAPPPWQLVFLPSTSVLEALALLSLGLCSPALSTLWPGDLSQHHNFNYHQSAVNSHIFISSPDLLSELQACVPHCLLRYLGDGSH